MATAPNAVKVTPAVIVGVGRVGRALQEMGSGQDLLVKRGEPVPLDFEGPILVCTRNDDLDAVLEATPKPRWSDQVLAYFAVSKLGEPPTDGKTDTNPVGLTAAYGKWASAVAARLHAGGLSCKKQMLEKLIWISAFMLVGARHPGATVGVVEKEFRYEVSSLITELASAAAAEKGIVFEEAIEERLCAYARAVAHFPTAVKEFKWRNGWFYSLSEKAVSEGKLDPCPLHTSWLKELKRMHATINLFDPNVRALGAMRATFTLNLDARGDVRSKNFCLASPPSFLQVFNPKIEATDDSQDREGCKLAFLVNQTWFESNVSDPFSLQYRDYVPAELGWTMNVNTDDPVHCRGYYNESFRSECVCGGGYEGIPYLGCIDVDECKESKHSCRGLLKCVNTRGSFDCEINKLYIALIGAIWIQNFQKEKKKKGGNGLEIGVSIDVDVSSSSSSSTDRKVFNPKIEATDDSQDREGCKLAFLVNQTWFKSNISDPFTLQHRDYVPAELGWAMNVNADDPVYCRGYYNRSFGSECVCRWGYEGIPDLGCIGKYFFPPKI
ncbi:hypothetical protein H0E87_003655 [Populus deltoides]|uniref:Uncharacterized protein n=1 Tax=Populus deltoides TaxID=3696 RepID=A0A8T3A0T6_POPDE|nr:hypothetical protein H0E87_003655 [Populus deltoides]